MTGQITRLLTNGQADAAVWTSDEMQATRPGGILDRALAPSVRARIGDSDTRAALVGTVADAAVLRAVTAQLEAGEVARIQQDVMSGQVVPEY
jgi:hypothetical protein